MSHGSDTHTFTPTTWICTIMISTLIDTDRTCILYSLVPDASVCYLCFYDLVLFADTSISMIL